MTIAEKFYKNFLDNYSGSYGADFDAYMYDLGERISNELEPFIEKEVGGSIVAWSGDYYSNNSALFDDGSELIWNYKNEIEVY